MAVERPKRPSLEELREVVQPPHIRSRATAEHWTGTLYMRHISIYLTRILVATPISANGVTALMVLTGFLAGVALLIPGIWGPVLAALLAQLQMYLDASDGEVARWRGVSSPKGIFLDQVGHFVAEGSIGLFLGVRAAGLVIGSDSSPEQWYYIALGAFLMAGIWFNKALNSMVVVARQNAGLGRLPDDGSAGAVAPTTVVGRLRRFARFLPFHRMFHSIEMTLLTLGVALVALVFGSPPAVDRVYAQVMTMAIYVVCAGHFAAIWSSSRLTKDVA